MQQKCLWIQIQATSLRLCFVVSCTILLAFSTSAAAVKPITIPSVRQWSEGTNNFLLTPDSRIVVDKRSITALAATAEVFANDLQYLNGLKLPVRVDKPQNGDIYLRLETQKTEIGAEGYQVVIGSQIEIVASTETGVFYGTRTLLQLFAQSRVVAGGTIRDWPDYSERGLLVDVGRKYYSLQWLENQIRDLAYLKLNCLHLHLTDNMGFRIESSTHPELNRGTSPLYSKAEIRTLIALGQQYHVTIIPEIEMLAHADPILAVHPELRLTSKDGVSLPDKADPSLPATRALVSDLMTEYLDLFPGNEWAIGADEYLHPEEYANYPQLQAYARSQWGPSATGIDAFLGYVNWIDDIIRAHGKSARVWGDPYEFLSYTGTSVGLRKDIVLEPWNGLVNPNDMIRDGYTITNANFWPLYYVLGDYQSDPKEIYEQWAPNLKFGKAENWSVPARDPRLLGAKFFIWADNPSAINEDEVAAKTQNCVRGVAQNTWGSPKLVPSYAEFIETIRITGHAPGWGHAAGAIAVTPLLADSQITQKKPRSY